MRGDLEAKTTRIGQSIDLDLPTQLRDPQYRKQFFVAETSAKIAEQIIALRKRRGLSQTQVAEKANTRQPAISRAERADYQNWSFNTLRAIAGALDARLRVLVEASEDVIDEYREEIVPDLPMQVAFQDYQAEGLPSKNSVFLALEDTTRNNNANLPTTQIVCDTANRQDQYASASHNSGWQARGVGNQS